MLENMNLEFQAVSWIGYDYVDDDGEGEDMAISFHVSMKAGLYLKQSQVD